MRARLQISDWHVLVFATHLSLMQSNICKATICNHEPQNEYTKNAFLQFFVKQASKLLRSIVNGQHPSNLIVWNRSKHQIIQLLASFEFCLKKSDMDKTIVDNIAFKIKSKKVDMSGYFWSFYSHYVAYDNTFTCPVSKQSNSIWIFLKFRKVCCV